MVIDDEKVREIIFYDCRLYWCIEEEFRESAAGEEKVGDKILTMWHKSDIYIYREREN